MSRQANVGGLTPTVRTAPPPVPLLARPNPFFWFCRSCLAGCFLLFFFSCVCLCVCVCSRARGPVLLPAPAHAASESQAPDTAVICLVKQRDDEHLNFVNDVLFAPTFTLRGAEAEAAWKTYYALGPDYLSARSHPVTTDPILGPIMRSYDLPGKPGWNTDVTPYSMGKDDRRGRVCMLWFCVTAQ